MSRRNRCCGTHEHTSCWFSTADTSGIIFVSVVWMGFIFLAIVLTFIRIYGHVPLVHIYLCGVLATMALWSHMKTVCTDPGSVPADAMPLEIDRRSTISICGKCDSYKPPKSHHDRVSSRCIARMDHWCPWTNNAIGAKNQKHFFLFLIYADISAIYAYSLMISHLIYCSELHCRTFVGSTLVLVRIAVFVVLFAILFTSSMILNQTYGLKTGLGTVDR